MPITFPKVSQLRDKWVFFRLFSISLYILSVRHIFADALANFFFVCVPVSQLPSQRVSYSFALPKWSWKKYLVVSFMGKCGFLVYNAFVQGLRQENVEWTVAKPSSCANDLMDTHRWRDSMIKRCTVWFTLKLYSEYSYSLEEGTL